HHDLPLAAPADDDRRHRAVDPRAPGRSRQSRPRRARPPASKRRAVSTTIRGMRSLLLACVCVIAIGCGESHTTGDPDAGGSAMGGGGTATDSSVPPGADSGLPADLDAGPPIVVLDSG